MVIKGVLYLISGIRYDVFLHQILVQSHPFWDQIRAIKFVDKVVALCGATSSRSFYYYILIIKYLA